jgi:hypothetical protein
MDGGNYRGPMARAVSDRIVASARILAADEVCARRRPMEGQFDTINGSQAVKWWDVDSDRAG